MATNSARDTYYKSVAPAQKAYAEEIEASRSITLAWEAYEKALASAQEDYAKAIAPAQKTYAKAAARAFVKAMRTVKIN